MWNFSFAYKPNMRCYNIAFMFKLDLTDNTLDFRRSASSLLGTMPATNAAGNSSW